MPLIIQTIAEAEQGETPDSYQHQYSCDTYIHVQPVTPLGTVVNQLVAMSYLFAKVKSLYIYSDTAMTIKTDSTGSPEQTLTLVAGEPVIWNASMVGVVPCPLSSDISTGWYLNATSNQVFKLRIGLIL